MTKKRYSRKKQKNPRMGCLLGLVLVALGAVAALILVLRPSPGEGEGTPLSEDALWDGSWYEDDLGRIQNDRPLIRGMKAFEKKTGAKPYLSMQNGIEPEALDSFAQEQYGALFNEGDHLLVIYDEWGEGVYYLSARTGEGSALTAADVTQLLACLEKAYADPTNKTYADAFGAGFRRGAKEMTANGKTGGVGLLIGLGVTLMALSVILILFLRKRARTV